MSSCHLPSLPTLSSSTHRCLISPSYGAPRHTNSWRPTRLRQAQRNQGFFVGRRKGAGEVKVAADENHLEAKVKNLTLDMAQTITDLAAVNFDVKSLKMEISLLKDNLQAYQADTDRLNVHESRYLEILSEYVRPFSIFLVSVIAFELVATIWLLVIFLNT